MVSQGVTNSAILFLIGSDLVTICKKSIPIHVPPAPKFVEYMLDQCKTDTYFSSNMPFICYLSSDTHDMLQ
jgi:hypothetical protein